MIADQNDQAVRINLQQALDILGDGLGSVVMLVDCPLKLLVLLVRQEFDDLGTDGLIHVVGGVAVNSHDIIEQRFPWMLLEDIW